MKRRVRKGAGLGHRKLIPYFKEFAGGDSVWVVPDMRSTTHVVRCGKVASRIYSVADQMGFLSTNIRATTFLLAGPDPFAASADFSARFRRDALPVAVGGTLEIGTASPLYPPMLGRNTFNNRLHTLEPRFSTELHIEKARPDARCTFIYHVIAGRGLLPGCGAARRCRRSRGLGTAR